MSKGTDLFQVAQDIWSWEIFSEAHKVELTSQAVRRNGKLYVFDPVGLEGKSLGAITTLANEKVVILTNGNHLRDAVAFLERFNAPIWVPAHANLEIPDANTLPIGKTEWEGWRLHPLPGATPGETAFEAPELSLMIFGDAIVNPANRGLELLPDQYCVDKAALETALRDLVARRFEIALTAHGKPIPEKAVDRIRLILRLQSDNPPQNPRN